MHKVFISYHHKNDQVFKEELLKMNSKYNVFIDYSVDTGDISDDLTDDVIREKIRDEYLKESSVTILLVGTETKKRKHIDWELFSSMYDGKINKKSGILVINLPSINCGFFTASHTGEKERVYPAITEWMTITSRSEFESRYPYMPDRIIDNLLKDDVKISVVNWDKIIGQPSLLEFLINCTYNDKNICVYDLSREMRRSDS